MSYVNNARYQVKTPSGWQDFSGVKKTIRNGLIRLITVMGKELTMTPEHKLSSSNGDLIYAKDLKDGDHLDGDVVKSIEFLSIEEDVYDLINVEGGHLYYTNDLVSSNCAFIRDFDTIWTGLYPTISTGGSAILLSTPNGVGGQYYKIWTQAEAGHNEFNAIRLPWTVHPEHDDEWFKKETKNLSRRNIAQEFECDFISSGETYLQSETMDQIRTNLIQPKEKSTIDRDLWIWKEPVYDHRYIISADVARGDSNDFSAFQVIDVDESPVEVVAEYKGKAPPDRLAELLIETGMLYNKALLCPENNTFGFTTCMRLKDKNYPRLFYASHRGDPFEIRNNDVAEIPGFTTQQKSRVQILTNLEQALRNGTLKVYSQRLYAELQSFVWHGVRAQAAKDSHDDLIMSLAIGVWLALDSGTIGNSTMDMAQAILKATGTMRRDVSQLSTDIQNVGPVKGHWATANNYAQKSEYMKPRDPSTVKYGGNSINDFSWLLK